MKLEKCTVKNNIFKEEKAQHKNSLFPISAYFEDIKEANFPWHWHQDFEIIWSAKGSLQIDVASNSITINEGQGIFINSGVLHAVNETNSLYSILSSIVYEPRLVGSCDTIFFHNYLKPIMEQKQIPFIILNQDISWQKSILHYAKETWLSIDTKPKHYEFTVRNLISKLTIDLIENNNTLQSITQTQIRRNDRCKILLDYIHAHFNEPITIKKLGTICNISETEVLRCFKITLHTSPLQYINQYRLQQALTLLHGSELTIIEIALSCGFTSSSYFTKVFKENMHQTPSQYLKNNNKYI